MSHGSKGYAGSPNNSSGISTPPILRFQSGNKQPWQALLYRVSAAREVCCSFQLTAFILTVLTRIPV